MTRPSTCSHCGERFETITECKLHQEECDQAVEGEGDLVPDYRDPFSPDRGGEREMKCLHCGERFSEGEIVYERRHGSDGGLWWCPNEECSGRGVGMDLHVV